MDSASQDMPRVYNMSRVESKSPEIDWPMVWIRMRMPCLGSSTHSFLFKLINNILPTDERLARILPNSSCYCKVCVPQTTVGDIQHWLLHCQVTDSVGLWLLQCISRFSPSPVTRSEITSLSFNCCQDWEESIVWVTANTLRYLWESGASEVQQMSNSPGKYSGRESHYYTQLDSNT